MDQGDGVKLLLLLLILGSNHGKRPAQPVDTIERNTIYDDNGKECFTQIILWRWNEEYMRNDVGSWVIEDKVMWATRGLWWDGQVFTSGHIIESHTHTSADPERVHKRLLEDKMRIPFIREVVR
jgi:hypothetical protein